MSQLFISFVDLEELKETQIEGNVDLDRLRCIANEVTSEGIWIDENNDEFPKMCGWVFVTNEEFNKATAEQRVQLLNVIEIELDSGCWFTLEDLYYYGFKKWDC